MRNFKDVKSINFELILEGEGCVNWDTTEQGSFLRNTRLISKSEDGGFMKKGKMLSNINFSKKVFSIDEEGNDQFKHKVSSECLRHNIFSDAMPFQNPLVANIPSVLYSAISTQDAIIRGYMFAGKEKTIKKKSALMLTDAVEIGPWRTQISLDLHTRSGMKNDSDDKETKDTSLYKKENVGHSLYKATGAIDLTELQFISNDLMYDRQATNLDGGLNEKVYFEGLRKNMVNFEPKRGFYFISSAFTQDEWAEDGILLNKESVDAIVKKTLKQILDINVIKRDAFLKTKSLIITVNHGESRTVIEISHENIDDLYFSYFQKYKEADEEKIIRNKKMVEDYENALKEAAKKEKAKGKKKSNKDEEEE